VGKVNGFTCPKCKKGYAVEHQEYRCVECYATLEVELDLSGLEGRGPDLFLNRRDRSIWRWREFFPIETEAAIVTLGEGGTPLLAAERLRREVGGADLYLKNDTLLPTGSLKDRSNAVGISRAVEEGRDVVAVASTGNAASSVAAYAARAGLQSVVFVPEITAPEKVVQAAAYGARIVRVQADYDETAHLYGQALKQFGWYNCLSSNPFRNEGKKSYTYEIWVDLDGRVPDWVIHPTAGGTGAAACWKGFNELYRLSWIDRLPRIVAAQAAACAPVVQAFHAGRDELWAIEPQQTIAESIRVGKPSTMAWRALQACRDSGGTAVALSEEEIERSQRLLATEAGIFAEPAGAVSLGAAIRLAQDGLVDPGHVVVAVITGHGLKQPSSDLTLPAAIPPDLTALGQILQMS
ncbi:MAG: threonine synthase, partial [Candidatus Methylomirabilales bacterium]